MANDIGRSAEPRRTSGSGAPSGNSFTIVDAAAVILGRPLRVHAEEQVIVPFTGRNAVAVLRGEDARQAVVDIEGSGIEGDRISFLRLDEATLTRDGDPTPAPSLDPGGARREESGVAAGVAIGAIVGAVVIGLVVWALADGTTAIWGAVGGAALFGALGGLWAMFRRVGASPAWERSLHLDSGDQAIIGVHVDDGQIDDVCSVFGVERTWIFAADGAVLHKP